MLRLATQTSFLTVTVHHRNLRHLSPGNYDPKIAETLKWYSRDHASRTTDTEKETLLLSRAERWHLREQQMWEQRMQRRGRKLNWWRDPYDYVSSIRNRIANGTGIIVPASNRTYRVWNDGD